MPGNNVGDTHNGLASLGTELGLGRAHCSIRLLILSHIPKHGEKTVDTGAGEGKAE